MLRAVIALMALFVIVGGIVTVVYINQDTLSTVFPRREIKIYDMPNDMDIIESLGRDWYLVKWRDECYLMRSPRMMARSDQCVPNISNIILEDDTIVSIDEVIIPGPIRSIPDIVLDEANIIIEEPYIVD